MLKKIFTLSILALTTFSLSACGSKTATLPPSPTPAVAKIVDLPQSERPLISLSPRADGHLLYLQISKIPASISSIEYELIYTATDGSMEIEKGLGDTIKDIPTNRVLSRDLLLGTESCTNGCKYKYDDGVKSGTLSLNFIDSQGQMSTFETPFSLRSAKDIIKEKQISLSTENFSLPSSAKLSGLNAYYVLLKQYKGGYSVFSNLSSAPLVGDYPATN